MTRDKVDLKVVLLGRENSGKTSLVERYVNHRFVERAGRYQATIGAAYASRKMEVDDQSFLMAIWDTAGSERYEAMSKMYYRNARAAIICFDLTDKYSFERTRFWVHEIQKNEESCRIYLCGTKSDLVTDSTQRRVEAKTVASFGIAVDAPVFETSSKSGQGVDSLFETIARDYVGFQMQASEGNTVTLNDGDKIRWKCPCFV